LPIGYFGDYLEPWLALHKAIDELLTRQTLIIRDEYT
jgi:hypothetical protein